MRSGTSAIPKAAAAAAATATAGLSPQFAGLAGMLAAKEREEMQELNNADELELPMIEWGRKVAGNSNGSDTGKGNGRADRRQNRIKS